MDIEFIITPYYYEDFLMPALEDLIQKINNFSENKMELPKFNYIHVPINYLESDECPLKSLYQNGNLDCFPFSQKGLLLPIVILDLKKINEIISLALRWGLKHKVVAFYKQLQRDVGPLLQSGLFNQIDGQINNEFLGLLIDLEYSLEFETKEEFVFVFKELSKYARLEVKNNLVLLVQQTIQTCKNFE